MKKILSIICVLALCLGIFAACGEKIETKEELIVTVVYNGTKTEVKTNWWNGKAIVVKTKDASLGTSKIHEFSCVKLSELMTLVGATDCTKAIVKSTDGYSCEVAVEDFTKYDIALTNAYASGKAMEADAGGPLKLIYPITDYPELEEKYDAWSWQWYVGEVEFVK